MLHDCNYNKIRLLHDLSRIAHFVKNHAKGDSKKGAQHTSCHQVYVELEKDLEKHIKKLGGVVAELSKKGNFK